MKIPVALEIKLPGRVGTFSAAEQVADMEYLGQEIRFASPLAVEAEYVFDGKGFSVKGSLSTSLHAVCALCAKEFEAPFTAEFEERFMRNPSEDAEEECYAFAGEELDISQMLSDTILLNMQPYSVCRQDCRGLCPVCGCDLNTAQCSCAREVGEETQSPFAALKTLLNDDKEV
ncbi:MAG: DUF177 domain-containing protein [Clostridia bacterium]|nr:DUF177 domain-containing protein [Clostridia bacterium]MBQ6692208.1 DUF177 domain-containing protein [Clostridia bacterium]